MADPNTRAQHQLPFLRGINFSGLTHLAGNKPPHPAAVEYYVRQKHMNVVRLNFSWEFIQPRLCGELDEVACTQIQTQIDRIAAAGAYVVIELHNYGRRTVDGVECIIGETPQVGISDFADVWSRIAFRWRSFNRVLFALMNEPHDQNTAVLVAASNAAIVAIRQAGADQLVMVSGNGWNSLGWTEGSDNRSWMLQICDPANNFCFDVHHYFDDYSRGQTPNVRENPNVSMTAFTEWARKNGKRGFCGEFACSVNTRGLRACRELLKHIESSPDVYVGWAWWGGGGAWQPDYIFLLDPFASEFSTANTDIAGSKKWTRPVDRPQMKMLQEFLPQSATRFNAWLIEDQLKDQIFALYRRGDYLNRASGGEWTDSGALGITARRAKRSTENDDGAIRFEMPRDQFFAEIPFGGQEVRFFALQRMHSAPGAYYARCALIGSGDGSRHVNIECGGAQLDPIVKPTWLNAMGIQNAVNADTEKYSSSVVIGAIDRYGHQMFRGSLLDILIIGGRITSETAARIQGRMHWDSGIAHNLPLDHPYREHPPSLVC